MSDCGGDCGSDGGDCGNDSGGGSYGGDYGGGDSGGSIEIKSCDDDYGSGHSGGSIEIKSCDDDYGSGGDHGGEGSGGNCKSGSGGDDDCSKNCGGKTDSGEFGRGYFGGDIIDLEDYHHGSANVWLHDDDPSTYRNVYTSPHSSYYRSSRRGVGRVGSSSSDCYCPDSASAKCITITIYVVTGMLVFYIILVMMR
ncbi:loricrin-like [Neodiprion fabricii]|uniref:loricrin-like n=1 Tax=Neodiprion fabricii TaxID=2872261 RepID=UPI001ED9532A|nr:loricrin-like [Neodiprion fabricii]XP_046428607.1 loricrin-like [Neodiprion fabricii]